MSQRIFNMKLYVFSVVSSDYILPVFGAFLLLLSGCAGQRPPEGGPIDTTSPEIVEISPIANTTNYAKQRISLEFNKYVDRRSVEESIFISPYVRDIEFDWSDGGKAKTRSALVKALQNDKSLKLTGLWTSTTTIGWQRLFLLPSRQGRK